MLNEFIDQTYIGQSVPSSLLQRLLHRHNRDKDIALIDDLLRHFIHDKVL